MNKIYTGIVTLVALVALVSSTAYAAFSSHVTAAGVTLGVATAGLELWADGNQIIPADQTLDVSGFSIDPLVPGEQKSAPFQLKNSGDVDLSISGQTAPVSGDGSLNDLIWVYIENTADTSHSSGWHTLTEWNAGIQLNDVVVAHATNDYKIYYKLDASAGDGVEGHSIKFNFTINGDQVL